MNKKEVPEEKQPTSIPADETKAIDEEKKASWASRNQSILVVLLCSIIIIIILLANTIYTSYKLMSLTNSLKTTNQNLLELKEQIGIISDDQMKILIQLSEIDSNIVSSALLKNMDNESQKRSGNLKSYDTSRYNETGSTPGTSLKSYLVYFIILFVVMIAGLIFIIIKRYRKDAYYSDFG